MSDRTISHYEIHERLGEGGMGVVYLAYDPRLERQVAIKVLSDDLSRDQGYRQRFLTEARSASALNHPNIVTIYEIGSDQGCDFIAMEYVEGRSLQELMVPDKPLAVAELVDLGIQLASALTAAHRAGIIHGDLKPGNVVVTPEGRAKILDFGLARRHTGPRHVTPEPKTGDIAATVLVSQTDSGLVSGTPGYMAPEKARGEAGDQRADIFSLGCILYALATGKAPFTGDSVVDVLHSVIHQEPASLDNARPGLPAAFRNAVDRCLAKQADDRYADAADLENDFREIQAGLTVRPGDTALYAEAGTRPTRHKALFIGMGVLAIVIVGAAFLFFRPDQGVATTTVTVVDEEGKQIQREIPTREYRKRLAILPFEPAFTDTSRFWLGYAASNLLLMDLFQDHYLSIDQMAEYEFAQEALKSGFPGGRGAPLALKRRVAKSAGCSHFVTGKIGASGDSVWTEVQVYTTSSGRLESNFRQEGKNLAEITDLASVWLRRELGIPAKHLQEWPDLPVADLSTSSPAAMEAVGRALVAIYEHNDLAGMRQQLENAVSEDPSFAWALWSLYFSYLFAGEGENPRTARVLNDLMTHLYRLPERLQFAVKANYFEYSGDPDKQLAVLKMWAELYPDDNLAHEVLVQLFWIRGKVKEAFAALDRLLALEPDNTDYLNQAATMHRELGNLETAQGFLESITEVAPDDPQALVSLGELMQGMGQHQEAKESFDKALVLQPRNPDYRLALAGAEYQLGNIASAIELTEAVLADPLSPNERINVQEALAEVYERTGQLGRAIQVLSTALDEGEGQVSPLTLSSARGMLALLHASHGDREAATQIITDLRSRLTHPLTVLGSIYALRVHLELEDYASARQATVEIYTAIQEMKWEHMRPTWLRGMGQIHEGESKPDSALVYYDRWQQLEPTDSRAMLRRGRCLRKLQKFAAADEAISSALLQRPYDANYLLEAALLAHERGDSEEAIAHLERALEVWSAADPDYAPAQEARANLNDWQKGS